MKKIILLALSWPLFTSPYAQDKQKEKTNQNSQEIIIIKSGDKEKKLTIETKDGEVFINGKPASEYKDGDVNVVKQKFYSDQNFLFAPGADKFHLQGADKFRLFNDDWGKDKAFLGVTTETADGGGATVTNVTKGSAADKAGLKEGDVITRIGDKNINDQNDVLNAVTSRKAKEEVTISYKRGGKAADVKATLGERKTFSRSFSFDGDNWDSSFNFKMPKIPSIPLQNFGYRFGRGKLGLRIEDTENDNGVKVTEVHDESAAAKAGLKENDVITEVNGKKVKDVNEVRKELAEVKDKTSYNIKAKRNGADMNFEIKIPKKINKADL